VVEFILTQVSQNAAGLVAVTPEIGEYERSRTGNQKKPSLVYPNGIFPLKDVLPDERSPIPELLFVVPGFPPWQGLDQLVESIKRSTAECKIHTVRMVPEELTDPLKSDSRFHTHGYLDSSRIKALSPNVRLGSPVWLSNVKEWSRCVLSKCASTSPLGYLFLVPTESPFPVPSHSTNKALRRSPRFWTTPNRYPKLPVQTFAKTLCRLLIKAYS